MGSLRTNSSGPSSVQNSSSPTPSLGPSNDDIEAVIQMATSARPSPDGRGGPLRDTRTQLFVGNLPYRVRWQDLKDIFRKAGTVLRADVSLGPDNRSRGYGTVLLATAEDAGRAVDMFNGYSWQTRILEVRPDRLPPEFDNSLGAPQGTPFSGGVGNGPSPLGASSFGPSGQNTQMPSAPVSSQSMTDEIDYNSLYAHEGSTVGGRNLFVGNLPFHCQWQDLKDLFRQAGTIIRADVALGQDGRSRGFGTVVFATDIDAERAVKMFNGYEYNGRLLKVHYDKFSQSSQPTTAPTSPTLQPSFHHTSSFGSHMVNPPNHIPMPMSYHFDFGVGSGPSSPFGGPPNGSMPQPHPHPISVEHLSASLASANLGGNGLSDDRPHSAQSQHQQNHHNHHHAHPGPISLPPPPSANAFPMPAPHTLSPHPASPLHHPMSPMQHHHHPLMTPHGLPPITPSMPPFSFLPQPSPHGHPASSANNMQSLNTPPIHAAHVLSTFSPGVAMSPGAFWGRPGGGVNPFINPAVGAPVHGSPGGFFAMNMQPVSPAGNGDEPAGYFPQVQEGGYFPPMASSSLANEILRDKSGDADTPGSNSSETTDMGTRDGGRRASSSTATSWHTPDEETKAREASNDEDKEASSSFLPDESTEEGLVNGSHAISRTNSMSTKGKTADRIPMIRGGSDPVQAHPRLQGIKNKAGHGNSKVGSAGADYGRAGERWKGEGLNGLGLSIDHAD